MAASGKWVGGSLPSVCIGVGIPRRWTVSTLVLGSWCGCRCEVASRWAVTGAFAIIEAARPMTVTPVVAPAAMAERASGHGFGIAIARELAELHGGTLELARADLGGLSAVLRLPGGSA
jgi:hypothetical protein